MIIKTKLTEKEYLNASLLIVWSRMTVKVFSIVFLFIILSNIFSPLFQGSPLLPVLIPPIIIFGVIYFLFRFSLKRAYKNNNRVNESIEYDFNELSFKIKGESFTSELSWNKMYKVTKTKKWLLLWHNAQSANAILLNKISTEQLNYLKNILQKQNVKNNL